MTDIPDIVKFPLPYFHVKYIIYFDAIRPGRLETKWIKNVHSAETSTRTASLEADISVLNAQI